MKHSFRNADGVLTAWGYVDANGSDQVRSEPDDFALAPGKWQLVNEVWVPYRESAQAAAWEAIKAERDRRKSCGVQVDGKWFHSDADSRIQWIGLKDQARDVFAAGGSQDTVLQRLGKNIMWKTMSGAFVPATVGLAFAVVEAVGDLDAAAFGAAEQHRLAMEASADPAAYDFTVGWPPIYGE